MPNYTIYAKMTCGGCSGAITRLLSKMDGVTEVKCDIASKSVVIITDKDFGGVQPFLDKITPWSQNAGKEISATPFSS